MFHCVKVFDYVKVFHYGKVFDYVKVLDYVKVFDYLKVFDYAQVFDYIDVFQDSSHLLGRCLASAANAGPALTPPPFLAYCVCWAKRTTVDHVLIWWLDIFPAVARHYTNSRRGVLNRCYFSVGSASSIVDQR